MRAVGAPGQAVGDDRGRRRPRSGSPSGSSRYSAAIGRASCSSSIVPGEEPAVRATTLPSLNRVPGTRSGPVRKVSAPVSKSSRWKPSTSATTAPPPSRSAERPDPRRHRPRAGGARARVEPVQRGRADVDPVERLLVRRPDRALAQLGRASRTQHSVTVGQRRAHGAQLGLQLLQHPAVDGVGVFLPAEHAHRGDPVERLSRKVAKNSSQSRSPLPISLCWWIRASTPGGLMM